MKWVGVIVFFILVYRPLTGQSPYMLRGDQTYHTYDRMEIMQKGDTSMVNSINNYDRKQTIDYFKKVWKNDDLTPADRFDLLHIFSDNLEFLDEKKEVVNTDTLDLFKTRDFNIGVQNDMDITKERFQRIPFLKYFYKSQANFLQLETPAFSVFINPVAHMSYLKESGNENVIFQNTRGIEIRAYIDQKVYIYTQLLENQRSYLSFIDDRIQKFGTIPGQGSWKNYESSVIGKLKGYDFFNARAYVGFNPVKSINMEFGHGNHFIGNGIRSLLLSDYSHNYFYLKFNTRIWKFQYQNIFAEMAPTSTLFNQDDKLLPKKYTATHYLAFKPNTKFEVGLFETVIFTRENHFEFQYLNPVILYRAVEHFLDSPDNVMLGLNVKWNTVKGISLYGQLILDEFKLSEVRKRSGWWANKFGGQFGIKYINVLGVDHLDLQVEYNVVRPYTYAHRDTLRSLPQYSVANYSHVNQPLAHPLGANFNEFVILGRYKPNSRIYVFVKALFTTYGEDRTGENWGGNILLPLESRQQDYGNVIGQGLKTNVKAINLDLSYEIYHNYFIDFQAMWRQTTSDVIKNQHYLGGGFRINIANITYDY
ncbi:MAG: hypothetical protein H7X99_08315 [Saprospiraceae bacterium]|nr:hypothetical protein [Saprospiraceae bacterium]